MNHITKISIVVVSILFLLSSCSLCSLIHEESRKEDVRVYLVDGTIINGKAKLPDVSDKSIKVNSSQNNESRLLSEKIRALAYRRDSSDVSRTLFIYHTIQLNGRLAGPYWMHVVATGPNLDICLCGAYYAYDKNGKISVQPAFNDHVYIVAFKREDAKGYFLGYSESRASYIREQLLDILGDDPVLCKKLIDRDILVREFEVICNQYAPESDSVEGISI